MRGLPKLGVAMRLALGLAMMTTCLLLALDMAIGLVPDPVRAASRVRVAVAEGSAAQLTSFLGNGTPQDWQRLMRRVRQQTPEIVVIALRDREGRVLASDGVVDRLPAARDDDRSTIDRLIVPIERNQQPWGRLEVVFSPVYPQTLLGWFLLPMSLALAGIMVLGVPLYALYLRRALQMLDPSNAVPDRVRAAFDTLAEGVVVLDKNGRIVLANQIFRDMMPNPTDVIIGKRAADLAWLTQALRLDGGPLPWTIAIEGNQPVQDVAVEIHPVGSASSTDVMRYLLSANPINDGSGQRRGCIMTFNDVSALHQSNERLTGALQTLEQSQAQIRTQNEALHRLASRDPMTDCLNRRAFFEEAATLWAAATADGRSITLAMCDIDFFKKVNDNYGHAAGDQVIKATADWLRAVSRSEDLVCRMGGEEFCVVWLNLPPEQAFSRADALRLKVEQAPPIITEAGDALKVTMSIGVVCDQPARWHVEQMLEQADQALYEAKRSGRNRVVQWPFAASTPVEAPASRDALPMH